MLRYAFRSVVCVSLFFFLRGQRVDAGFTLIDTLPQDVPVSAFVLNPERSMPLTVSPTQQGGAYRDAAHNAVATVASAAAPNPYFELTIVNNTGGPLNSLNFSGEMVQYKDNSSNNFEQLTVQATGALLTSLYSSLTISSIQNIADGTCTVSSPPLTSPLNQTLRDFYLAEGDSTTLRWTDTNTLGTDAMLGLGNLSLTASYIPLVIPDSTHTDIGGSLSGNLAEPGQVDWYSFDYDGQTDLHLDTFGSQLSPNNDTMLGLYNSQGILVGYNDDVNDTTESLMEFAAGVLPADTYYLAIGSFYTGFGYSHFEVTGYPEFGTNTGEYVINGLSAPEPACGGLLMAAAALLFRRRRCIRPTG